MYVITIIAHNLFSHFNLYWINVSNWVISHKHTQLSSWEKKKESRFKFQFRFFIVWWNILLSHHQHKLMWDHIFCFKPLSDQYKVSQLNGYSLREWLTKWLTGRINTTFNDFKSCDNTFCCRLQNKSGMS